MADDTEIIIRKKSFVERAGKGIKDGIIGGIVGGAVGAATGGVLSTLIPTEGVAEGATNYLAADTTRELTAEQITQQANDIQKEVDSLLLKGGAITGGSLGAAAGGTFGVGYGFADKIKAERASKDSIQLG